MLLLFPLACGLLVYAIKKKSFLGKHDFPAMALKIAFLLLVTLAAAGLRTRTSVDRLFRIYLLDASNSTYLQADKAFQAVGANIKTLRENDKAGIVVFAGESSVELPPDAAANVNVPPAIQSAIDKDGTNLSSALKRLRPLLPGNYYNEIVLITDGNFTDPGWENEFLNTLNSGCGFRIVPAVPAQTADVRIEEVSVPQFALPGQPFEARVKISSSVYADAAVDIYRGEFSPKDRPATSIKTSLSANKPVWINFTLPAAGSEIEKITVIVKPDGWQEICVENNAITQIVRTADSLNCLIFSSQTEDNPLAYALQNALPGLQIQVRTDLKNLMFHDMLAIDNINYAALREDDKAAVESFTAVTGKGILWMGGENSFAPGGYSGTGMETMMPVLASPRDELALMVLLDSSGSMGESVSGKRKFSITIESLQSVLPMLSENDMAGVISFSAGSSNIKEIMPVGKLEDPEKLIAGLKNIQTGGGTELIPPVKTALEALKDITSPRKHLLLITDGESNEKLSLFAKLADQLKDAGISISIFATREDIDEKYCNNLIMLCLNNTNGRFGKVDRTFDLGNMLRTDLTITKELIITRNQIPVINDSGLWNGLKQLPELNKYNRTTLKEQATLHAALPNGDPLMASWRYKAGKTAVFTASFKKDWAENWLAWEERNAFVSGILKELLPAKRPGGIDTRARLEGNKGLFSVTITDRELIRRLNEKKPALSAILSDSAGAKTTTPLMQKEWNAFAGEFIFEKDGVYFLQIAASRGEETEMLDDTIISVPYSVEWARIGLNEENIGKMTSFENSRLAQNLEEVTRPKCEAVDYKNLGSYLLIAGVILLVISAWHETKS